MYENITPEELLKELGRLGFMFRLTKGKSKFKVEVGPVRLMTPQIRAVVERQRETLSSLVFAGILNRNGIGTGELKAEEIEGILGLISEANDLGFTFWVKRGENFKIRSPQLLSEEADELKDEMEGQIAGIHAVFRSLLLANGKDFRGAEEKRYGPSGIRSTIGRSKKTLEVIDLAESAAVSTATVQ
jgi:hypothetical protein